MTQIFKLCWKQGQAGDARRHRGRRQEQGLVLRTERSSEDRGERKEPWRSIREPQPQAE